MDSEALESLGIDPTARAETLGVEQYVTISNYLSQQPE
jgi:16S rRNA A1518/A1519 N6-dimethyltransferase RsmA/KsgA/DIM1 with predicted DNA glycosylase/AP lyase activity